MLPQSIHDRYAPSNKGISEANEIIESFEFMKRRDALLRVCHSLRIALPSKRIRLYEFLQPGSSGARFRGLVELGGMYANILKLELPLAADWFSRQTVQTSRHGEPILYPTNVPQPEPPRYYPWAFWKAEPPQEWIDILLMRGRKTIGKVSADNFRNSESKLPVKAGHCRTELHDLVETMRKDHPLANPSVIVEAHRRRILLNDLTDILQNMAHILNLDRARAYEFSIENNRFEARAEVGGTADPMFTSLDYFYHLPRTREDPISFFTYEQMQPAVYYRDEKRDFPGPNGEEQIHIIFKCDEKVGSDGLKCLADIPLIADNCIVGKITVDCIIQDPEGKEKRLDKLLEEKADVIKYFAQMAAKAITDANTSTGKFDWWQRFHLLRHGMSERTFTILIAIISAILGGAASSIVYYLLAP